MILKLEFGANSDLAVVEDEVANFLAGPEEFVGFRNVVVGFTINKARCRGPEFWSTAKEDRIKNLVKHVLEPTLGPAVEYEDNGSGCLGFRPWNFVKRRYQRLEALRIVCDSLGRRMVYTRFHETNRMIDGSEDGQGATKKRVKERNGTNDEQSGRRVSGQEKIEEDEMNSKERESEHKHSDGGKGSH